MMVDLDRIIRYLNSCAAYAYKNSDAVSGDRYSAAATRLFAAKVQGEFEEVSDAVTEGSGGLPTVRDV